MNKYYVNAGCVRGIILATDPKSAAISILEKFGHGKIPHSFTYVGQTGYNRKENTFQTDELLSEIYSKKIL